MAKRARAKELGRPVASDSERTRVNIINAAKECFGTAGFRSTSNRDIAERAGVTAATIYYYFKNKSDLFIAVYRETQEKVLAPARKAAKEATSLKEGWIEIARQYLAIHKTDPHMAKFNAVVRVEAMRYPELSEALEDQEWRDIFHQLAELGIRTGELDAAKDREIRAVLSALNFGISHHALHASMDAHEECIRGLTDLFRGDLLKS